jgi:hypothetical protein
LKIWRGFPLLQINYCDECDAGGESERWPKVACNFAQRRARTTNP